MTTRSPTGARPESTPRKETKPSTSREKHPFFCDKILVFFADDSTMSPFFAGSLAQSVEQLAFNQLVDGSNPSRPTIFSEHPPVCFSCSILLPVSQPVLQLPVWR